MAYVYAVSKNPKITPACCDNLWLTVHLSSNIDNDISQYYDHIYWLLLDCIVLCKPLSYDINDSWLWRHNSWIDQSAHTWQILWVMYDIQYQNTRHLMWHHSLQLWRHNSSISSYMPCVCIIPCIHDTNYAYKREIMRPYI